MTTPRDDKEGWGGGGLPARVLSPPWALCLSFTYTHHHHHHHHSYLQLSLLRKTASLLRIDGQRELHDVPDALFDSFSPDGDLLLATSVLGSEFRAYRLTGPSYTLIPMTSGRIPNLRPEGDEDEDEDGDGEGEERAPPRTRTPFGACPGPSSTTHDTVAPPTVRM